MTKIGTLTKGLLGASALSLFISGNAFAAPLNLTPAGTDVDNTFTLDYQVSGVDQPTIDTGPSGTNTPTTFTVDRLVDLTVTGGNTNVAPDSTGEDLLFSVTNTGNDTQAYALTLEDVVVADDFDVATLTITYYVDDGDGIFNAADTVTGVYTPGGKTPDILADGILWVEVTGDIPATVTNGDVDSIILVADTLEPSSEGAAVTPVIADPTPGNDLAVVENVLGDGTGDGATDTAADGSHSATGTFTVLAADITAGKTVGVILQDGVDVATCTAGTLEANALAIPGSCIEYVITAANATGVASATNLVISDFLPVELIYVSAVVGGSFTGTPVLAPLTVGTDCTETTAPETTCEVRLTGATLAAGASGTITIRALVE